MTIVFFSIITTITYILNLSNLNIVKLNYKDIGILMIINFLISIIALNFIKVLGIPMSLVAMIIYLNKINKEYDKNIIIVVLTIFIAIISDIILGLVVLNIINISKEQLIINTNLYVILHICVLVISFIISRVLGYIINKEKLVNIDCKFIKIISVTLLSGFIMIYLVSMIYKFSDKSNIILILNLILISIYFLLVAYITTIYIKSTKKEMEYKYKEKELEQLKEYITMVEATNGDIKKFRHDYLNILSTVNGYIENGGIEELKEYFTQNIIPISDEIKKKNISVNNLTNIQVFAIKGLLSYKIRQAQKLNIEVSVEILDKIETINMNIVDLCRIIGIFLDNAIEETTITKDKKIIICIIRNKKSVIINIANSYNNDIPPIYKIMEKGFSTKGENRGIGLNTVQEIIYKEYENVTLNTYIEKDLFSQELLIED